jgi:hypothetical protein
LIFAEKRDFNFAQNSNLYKLKFVQTCFLPNVRCSRSPTRCQMNVKNSAIKSHSRGLSNSTDSSICRRRVVKIQCPEDGVLDSYSGFFLDFLTTHSATRVWRVCFLLRAGTLHSCQQVVSSKSLVPLILCYIFPLLFLIIQWYFVRENVETKEVTLLDIPSNQQVADIFTKALPVALFKKFAHQLLTF